MNALISLHNTAFARIEAALADWLVPTLARLVFAGVLLVYFWHSALTKLGAGLFGFLHPSIGAYAQIFPRAFEAAGYDSAQLSAIQHLVALAGMWAEFTLPLLITIGLATRLAALAMIGFVAVQSYVDIFGHGIGAQDVGRWFDGDSGALIADQRAFWLTLLAVLVLRGAGPFSADRLLARQWASG